VLGHPSPPRYGKKSFSHYSHTTKETDLMTDDSDVTSDIVIEKLKKLADVQEETIEFQKEIIELNEEHLSVLRQLIRKQSKLISYQRKEIRSDWAWWIFHVVCLIVIILAIF
jgi:uncharacterized membrane protein (DUF106 family)